MRVYITKYALTQGIFEVEVDECDGKPGLVADRARFVSHYRKPDWHLTIGEAVSRALVMKSKKIASLRRQIRNIEALKFEDPSPRFERNES